MRALRFARWSLLASLLLWAAGFALVAGELIRPEGGLLVSLISIPAIAVSAAACVIIQLALFLRRPRT